MPEENYDVVIVGAGPAGIATAMHLIGLDAGWAERLIVLEKATHPRHKLCAGGITRFGLDQLSRLGLTLDVPFIPIEDVQLRYRNRSVSVRGGPIIVVTWRQEFDAWLANVARDRGVSVREDTPVAGLERHGDEIHLHTPAGDVHARVVVGADGSTGISRRWLGVRERPSHVARLLEVVTEASDDDPEHRNRTARLDFSGLQARLQGYFWDFPSSINGNPRMNCGVYDSRVDASRSRASLPDHLTAGVLRAERRGRNLKLQGHPIHWFSPWNVLSAPGVVLVGDAAGADPLFGEGIGVGLGYGAVAAKAIQRGFARHDLSFAGYRRSVLLSDVGRYLLLRWLVGLVAYRLAAVDLFIQSLWGAGAILAPLAHRPNPSLAIRPRPRDTAPDQSRTEDLPSIGRSLTNTRH